MALKEKIKQAVDRMSEKELKSAWLVIQEISSQNETSLIVADNSVLNKNLRKGLKQLDNGEGKDFGSFLNEMEVKYGKG